MCTQAAVGSCQMLSRHTELYNCVQGTFSMCVVLHIVEYGVSCGFLEFSDCFLTWRRSLYDRPIRAQIPSESLCGWKA